MKDPLGLSILAAVSGLLLGGMLGSESHRRWGVSTLRTSEPSRLICFTNAYQQRICILPSRVTQILPDFGNPDIVQVYLEGGMKVPIRVENRAVVEGLIGL